MQYTIPSLVVIVPALLLWLLAISVGPWNALPDTRKALLTLWTVYLLTLLHLVIFPIHVHTGEAKHDVVFLGSINFIPLINVRPLDFVLNILLTAPLGLLLPMVLRRPLSFGSALAIGIGVGCTFEGTQWLLRATVGNDRFVDINDILTNAVGCFFGYALYRQSLLNSGFALVVHSRLVSTAQAAPKTGD